MKRKLRRLLLARSLPVLTKEQIKLLQDTAKALLMSRRSVPAVIWVDRRERVWEIWDWDYQG